MIAPLPGASRGASWPTGHGPRRCITFSHVVDIPVAMTDALPEVGAGLGAIKAGGATVLRDAVHLALELQPRDRWMAASICARSQPWGPTRMSKSSDPAQ